MRRGSGIAAGKKLAGKFFRVTQNRPPKMSTEKESVRNVPVVGDSSQTFSILIQTQTSQKMNTF